MGVSVDKQNVDSDEDTQNQSTVPDEELVPPKPKQPEPELVP